jgi:hypothetical protein
MISQPFRSGLNSACGAAKGPAIRRGASVPDGVDHHHCGTQIGVRGRAVRQETASKKLFDMTNEQSSLPATMTSPGITALAGAPESTDAMISWKGPGARRAGSRDRAAALNRCHLRTWTVRQDRRWSSGPTQRCPLNRTWLGRPDSPGLLDKVNTNPTHTTQQTA